MRILNATLGICILFVSVSAQSDDRIPIWSNGQLADSAIKRLADCFVYDAGIHSPTATYAFQARSSKGVAQIGIDSFFDPAGVALVSTTAAGGLLLSANNKVPHFRIIPNGDIFIQGGSDNPQDSNYRTAMITLKALGNVPIGRIFESQNTLTVTNNASFNPATSEYFRDDDQYMAVVLEWGAEGMSTHVAPPGTGAINPGGVDWKGLGYLRSRIDTQKATFTNVNVGVGTDSPAAKLQVTDGDVYVQTQGKGIILKATDGPNCYRVTINNSGVLTTVLVTCP